MSNTWKDFVTNTIIGTERGIPLDLPDAVAATLDAPIVARQGRESRFLTRAGAYAVWRRAAWRPPVEARDNAALGGAAPAVAEPEEGLHTAMSRASEAHLRAMLDGKNASVLPEWLTEAVRVHRLVPPELLPALLDLAQRREELRPLALAAGGRRAAWLAGQNPAWSFAAGDHPEYWEAGNRDQRLTIFRSWRAKIPTSPAKSSPSPGKTSCPNRGWRFSKQWNWISPMKTLVFSKPLSTTRTKRSVSSLRHYWVFSRLHRLSRA